MQILREASHQRTHYPFRIAGRHARLFGIVEREDDGFMRALRQRQMRAQRVLRALAISLQIGPIDAFVRPREFLIK
jgi:hypothetical protein